MQVYGSSGGGSGGGGGECLLSEFSTNGTSVVLTTSSDPKVEVGSNYAWKVVAEYGGGDVLSAVTNGEILVEGNAEITVSADSVTGLSTTLGTPVSVASANKITVGGTGLSSGISASVSGDIKISTDGSSWGTTASWGTSGARYLWVQLAATSVTAENALIGTVTLSNAEAANVTVSVYGTVAAIVNPSPNAPTAPTGEAEAHQGLSWSKNGAGNNVMIVRYAKNAGTTAPTGGQAYTAGNTIGTGTVVYNDSGLSTKLTTGLTAGTEYDYWFYSVNGNYYSSGTKVTGTASQAPRFSGGDKTVSDGRTGSPLTVSDRSATGVPSGMTYSATAVNVGGDVTAKAGDGDYNIVSGTGVFTFTPAQAGTYKFTVQATNGVSATGSYGSYTLTVTVKPAAPTLTITGTDTTSLSGRVSGLEVGGTVTVKRYENQSNADGDTGGTTVVNGATATAATYDFSDTGLVGCSNYYYRAWSSHNGQSDSCSRVLGTTDFGTPAVTDVSAEVDGDTADITFQWGSVSGAAHYEVQVANTNEFTAGAPGGWDSVLNLDLTGSVAPSADWSTSGYTTTGSDGFRLGSGSNTGSLTSPTPDGLPGKRVRVIVNAKYYGTDGSTLRVSVAGGPSWESGGTNWNISLGSTTNCYTNFVNVANNQTGVTFTFASTASKKRVDLASIDISKEGEPTGGTIVASSGSLGPGVTEWTATGLEVGTSYWYRVQATSDRGCAEWSTPASYTVEDTAPGLSVSTNKLSLVGTTNLTASAKSFKLTGSNLTGAVTLTLTGTDPGAFQIRGWPTNGTAAWTSYTNSVTFQPVGGVLTGVTNQVRLGKWATVGTHSATVTATGGGLAAPVVLVTINGTQRPRPVLVVNHAETTVPAGGHAVLDFAAASGITNDPCFSYALTLPDGVAAAQTTFATNNGNMTYDPPASPPAYGVYAFGIAVTNKARGGAVFTWTVTVADEPGVTETEAPSSNVELDTEADPPVGSAVARASVDSGGADASVAFEYRKGGTDGWTAGTVTNGAGTTVTTVSSNAYGAGAVDLGVSLGSLESAATYEYRWTVAGAGGTNTVSGSFFVPGNGVEFPGGWNGWQTSGTTTRDPDFGGGNYYYTPAFAQPSSSDRGFKEYKANRWYSQERTVYVDGSDCHYADTNNWNNNTLHAVYEGYYTLRGRDQGGSIEYVAMYTPNPPVTVTNGADDSATAGTGNVTVTAELSAAPSGLETVYVRYTTDGWTNSTLATMTVSGTNVTGTIPGQPKGTTVEWYVLTSTHGYLESDPDLCTLRGMKSGSTNFCYTTALLPPRNATATAGYEKVTLAWEKNAAGNNTMIVRYPGTSAEVVQPSDGTAYGDNAQVGTGAGRVVYVNGDTTGVTNTVGVTQGTGYTYVLYSVEGSGGSSKYSEGVVLTATTKALAQPTILVTAAGAGTLGGAAEGLGEIYVVARTTGSDTFDGTASGGLPTVGGTFCGGTVVHTNTTASFDDDVTGCETYFYQAWLKAADEDAWSAGRKTSGVEMSIPGAVAVTGTNVYTDGFALSWTEADRADGYLISIWTGGETTTNTSATYDVVDKKTVTPGGTVPDGATAVFTNTCPNNNDQITAGKHMMLTLGGYAGKTITGLKLRMHSNAKVGAGTLSVTSGSSTLLSFGDTGFGDSTHWSTAYSSDYTVLDFTSQLTATTIAAGQTLVITITGTTNSLFCDKFEVLYETTVAGTEYLSGYGAGGGWATNGVAIGGMDPGTDYSYSLWAVGATTNCTGPVTTNLVHTDGTAKPNPPGLSLSVTDAETIVATVTRANGEAWELWRFATAELAASATEPPAAASEGVVRLGGGTTPATGSTTVTDTGLTGCTRYWYRAWEVNDPEGTPLWSNAREANEETATVGTPTGLVVASTNAHGATLRWGPVAGASGYDVEVWHYGMGWGSPKTVTYTFVTNNSAKYTVSGTAPAGSSATFSNHKWVNCVDAGHTNTMTLHGWGGVKITGLTMEMSSWEDDGGTECGKGSFTMTSGGSTLVTVPDSTFDSTNWYGAWSWSEVNIPMRVTETVVGETANVTLKLIGTEDSLFWESFTVTYEELEPGGRVYDWENGSGVGGVSVAVAGTNATVTGLTEATEYGWSVAATGGCTGTAAEGADFETTEMVVAPTVVTPLSVWVNGISGTVTGSADADTLWLYRFDDNEHAMSAVLPAAMGGTRVTNVTGGAGTWNFADTNLLGCKTYWYRAWLEDEIDGETFRSPGSTPASGRTEMAIPEPKGTGAGTRMEISWTNVPGATNYTLQVSDTTNTWTSLSSAEEMFREEFTSVPTGENTAISSSINTYTVSNGWVATNAYGSKDGGYPKMGAGSPKWGYLETPELAGLARKGVAKVDLKAYNQDQSVIYLELKYADGEWGERKICNLTNSWQTFQVAVTNPGTAFKVRMMASAISGHRFFVDNFRVEQEAAGGGARGLFYDETATSPTTIDGLEIGSNYFFRVIAHGEECDATGYGWAPTADAALLEVHPAKKYFGSVNKGQSVSNKFEVSNRGNIALKFAGVETSPAGCGFAVTWPTGSALRADIEPGSSREYWVTFTPTNSGAYSGTLRFVCNAANGEATEVATNKLVTVELTGTGYDPESADPEVIGFEITDALGTDGTVWDQSLALEEGAPVMKVTAWHASGIWTSLLPSTNRATWTLRGPDGAVATLENGTELSGRPFTGVRAVPHGSGADGAEFSAVIPVLGAGRAARGPYTLEVTVKDATGRHAATATNYVPDDARSALLDDFTRADVVADGTGKLERGWTAIMSGAATASEAAIHDGALELYGELGTSSGAAGRIAVVRDMDDVGYATTLHEFKGSGSWGFHFRSAAQLHAWDGSSMAGAFVLGSTQPGWLTASDGQAGLAVTLTTNGVQLASFTNSLLANADHPRVTSLGTGWTGNTAGKTLAVRVEFIAGKDAVDEGESDDGQAHDAIPAYLQLYVKEVSGTGGDPTKECEASDLVAQVEVPEAFTRMDLPYGGVVWAHGLGAAGPENSARFDDIHVPRMDGQSVPLRFWCVDDDTKAPTFDDFDVPAAIAAGTAATAGLSVTGTILDASGLWTDATGANAPTWETAAIAAPTWELWVNGTNVASGATTNSPAGNGAGTSVAVSFTIPGSAFDSAWRTTNCVVVVKAWDYDIDRPGDSKAGRAEYRFTLCDSTPTAPAWATVEADGAEMAVVRWAWTNGAQYVVVRGDAEFGETATPPQGTLTPPAAGLKYTGLGTVAYAGSGDNHLTNGWTAREVLVAPGSTNYFAVYGMTGNGTTGHFFSSPTRTKAYTWTATNAAGEMIVHWATEGDAEGGKPAAGSVWSNSWPMTTVPYETGEGIDAFAYRTSVSYPTNKIAESPATLALTYGYEARTGTGSGWRTNEPTGWQGDTNMWKIHDGSLLTGGTGYPTPAGNKLYWEDTSGESAVKAEAKLTRMLDYPETGDFFVAAILNYQYGGTGKWVTVSMVDESGNDLVSFGKQGGNTDTNAAIYTPGTSPFGDHTLDRVAGGSPYGLTVGHGNDHIVVGQLSRTDRKLRMWCYTGNMKIPEVYSKTAANGTEVGLGVATTALNTVRADWDYAADVTVPEVAGIRLCAGSDGNKALGHVYFDEVRFAATWEELFLFNEPEVETFDLSTPAGSGKANGTNETGMTQWLVSDGALAHGDVGLNATFELYHRTGIQSASFDILSGGSQGQTNLLREVTAGTTAAVGNEAASVDLEGTRGSVYGEWTTPDGGATGVAIPTNWISLESNYVLEVTLHSTGGREATATSATDNMGGGATDLFFGEYGEGAGNDKYVEIYNGTGRDVDLYNYWIVRPQNALRTNNGVIETNDFSMSYTNLYLNSAAVAYTRLSSNSYVLHHKQTVVLLNNVNNTNHTPRLNKLKEQLDARRAKYIVMPYNVLDSNGSVPYLLVKAEDFDETAVSNAFKNHTRVTLNWLDACGCADGIGATERYIMSRKATATHLPRSNPMIIDTNEWDYRRWSFPKTGAGAVDDYATVPPYTNFVATAGGYDRAIGLGGTMEFRVYDDDEAPPSLAGGGQGGGLRLKGSTNFVSSTAGDRTYVMGGWSFTNWDKEWSATSLTAEQCEKIAEMWPSGLTTNGGISWAPQLGESITNVVKGGSGKQTHVEFDGIEQTGYGALTIKANTNNYVSTAEVWIGFDLDVQDLAEPTVSFGYAGGTSGFSDGYVKVSATGAEGSFEMPNENWKFTPITGSGSTWAEWSQSLEGVLPEGAGHVWFRVCVKNYKNGSGSCWLDNFRVEGNPRAVRVTDQELADTGVVFEVRVRDESGVDAGAAGTNTSHGATFGAGLGETWYRRAPGTTNLVEGAAGATATNEYTSIQWTLADGAAEKEGGFGKDTAQEWYAKTQDGKGQLKVTVGDLDDDRADDQSVGSKNFGMLVVEDDDASPPQIRMKTMKPRLDGVVGEWLFLEKAWGAKDSMDGVEAGALSVCTTNGTPTKPRASLVAASTNKPGVPDEVSYAVYQTGWQAGSKYWAVTLRTTGGGKGSVTNIHFWSKVGSVNSPTGWELWKKTGDGAAAKVAAGSDTNGLLKTGGTTNTCWQKQSDEAAEGLAIGVWREYNIALAGANAIELPADGTPVEIRLMGKGAAAKGIGASWFLWDLKMEGELEQSTGEGEEAYTYKTDHEVAGGGGEALTMEGSVWDEGSGLAALPRWELTEGITGSGDVTFTDILELSERTNQTHGTFSVSLPVATTYAGLDLKEYRGTITATDADNDRNSAADGSGENYDSLTHTGKFGFTVIDQDVTKPTAPAAVKVNGRDVPGTAPDRTDPNVAWTNKPEFVVSFAVAVDQNPSTNWTDSVWTNLNVVGEVVKTNLQSGVSGIGEYRVALTNTAAALADGTPFAVAVTNGAIANYGFERYAGDIGWTVSSTNAVWITNSVVHEGTNSMRIAASSTVAARDVYARQIIVCEMGGATTVTVGGTMWFYQNGAGSRARIYVEAFSDEAMTSALSCSGGLDQSFGSNAGKDTWAQAEVAERTFTAAAGTARVYLRVTLYASGAICFFDDVRLSVRVGTAPAAGTADRASMRFVAGKASQGLNAKYLYAVDADNDRKGDRLAGEPAMFYTAYDVTPPTLVTINHQTGLDPDGTDDPTTQFDVTWDTAGVGPDNPSHTNHPTGTGTDVLSPWMTYRFYHSPFDEDAVPTNDVPLNEEKGYIYTNFIATGAYKLWDHTDCDSTVADPSATGANYNALKDMSTNSIRLYDLENDQHYAVVVVGVDKAGNEGPAGISSWATNNTIKFMITQGVMVARSAVLAAFPTNHNLGDGDRMAAGVYWNASKGTEVTGGVTNHPVKRDYDLIEMDGERFQESSNNVWQLVQTVKSDWFADAGGLTNGQARMRFYRAAYKDRWRPTVTVTNTVTTNGTTETTTNTTTQKPLMSEDVYAMSSVPLTEGMNYVSLHGYPYTNTLAGLFGTDTELWPTGDEEADTTRVQLFKVVSDGSNQVVNAIAKYTMGPGGGWYYGARDVTDTPFTDTTAFPAGADAFFTRGFSIELPSLGTNAEYRTNIMVKGVATNVGVMTWHPILRVPTNGPTAAATAATTSRAAAATPFSATIQGGGYRSGEEKYNFVSYCLPVNVHPRELRLVECGFGASTMSKQPGLDCDVLYPYDSVAKGVRDRMAMYVDKDGTWRYLVGNGVVTGKPLRANDALVIMSRSGGREGDVEDNNYPSWTWTYSPTNFYKLPTRSGGY